MVGHRCRGPNGPSARRPLRRPYRRIWSGGWGFARQIWNKAIPAPGTPTQTYLRSRGIDLVDIPPTLRYARLRHPGTGETYDVMVAAVGYGPVPDAIHRTFLAPGGKGKAKLPDDLDAKMSLGPIRGLPIRLDATSDADGAAGTLAVGEGIENALVPVQEFGVPAWSSISAGNMPLLRILDIYPLVTIVADHDPTGLREANKAARLWTTDGHAVRLALPPTPGRDFNKMLEAARRAADQEGTA
jgi:DNA primase